MARRASSRQRGAAYLQERGGRKTEPSPRFVIPSPARAGIKPYVGAASDGRVSDLLSGHEPAGRPAMARPAPSRRVLVGPCLVGGARVR